MADARVRITKRLVDGLEADGIIRHIQDTDVLGFAIKISALGHITYILQRWQFGACNQTRLSSASLSQRSRGFTAGGVSMPFIGLDETSPRLIAHRNNRRITANAFRRLAACASGIRSSTATTSIRVIVGNALSRSTGLTCIFKMRATSAFHPLPLQVPAKRSA